MWLGDNSIPKTKFNVIFPLTYIFEMTMAENKKYPVANSHVVWFDCPKILKYDLKSNRL